MFKTLIFIGILLTGNILCAAEIGSSSLEGDNDGIAQHFTASQISVAIPATKLDHLENIWQHIIYVHKENGKSDSIVQKIKEMENAFPDMSALTPPAMDTQPDLIAAYKYYKKVWKENGGKK